MHRANAPIALFLASLAVGIAAPALADRRSDDADDGVRDSSLWHERESYRSSGSNRDKCKVEETGGAIRFDSMAGKGGGAAYLSTWKSDWTDSFSVTFRSNFAALPSIRSDKAAFSGVGFGFDHAVSQDQSRAYRNGVQFEMQQTKAGGRTLQLVARKNGSKIAESVRVALPEGEHDFEVSWIANPVTRTVTVQVFMDGNFATPYLELTGFGALLEGRTGQGIGMSIFGYSTGKQQFASTFDDVDWFGDDHGESEDDDDDDWGDDDDHYDDHGGHGDDDDDDDDDGDDGDDDGGTDDGATLVQFTSALDTAFGLHADGVLLKAEAEFGWIDMVLSNPANASEVRFVRVRRTDGVVLVNAVRAPRVDELEALYVAPFVSIDPRFAMIAAAATVAPDSTVHEIELEDEDTGPVWKFEFLTTTGTEQEREQPAD